MVRRDDKSAVLVSSLSQIVGRIDPAQWTRQAGRSSASLQADVDSLVFDDAAAGAFEESPRNRIASQHDRASWGDRKYVCSHARELLVRDLHELHASIDEPLSKGHGQEWSVYDRKITVDRTHDRHEMEDIRRPAPVRQRHHDELVDSVAEERPKLCDARVVGPVAAAD